MCVRAREGIRAQQCEPQSVTIWPPCVCMCVFANCPSVSHSLSLSLSLTDRQTDRVAPPTYTATVQPNLIVCVTEAKSKLWPGNHMRTSKLSIGLPN